MRTVGLLLVALFASSCWWLLAYPPPSASKIASEWGCRSEEVTIKEFKFAQDEAKLVRGCGHVSIWHGAQGLWLNRGDPTARAAFDLRCAADQLSIQVLSSTQVGIVGCEREAAYVLTVSGWVLDSAVRAAPP